MKETLTGDAAIVGQALDKIELALRRAAAEWHSPTAYGLLMVADEIQRIKLDMYRAS